MPHGCVSSGLAGGPHWHGPFAAESRGAACLVGLPWEGLWYQCGLSVFKLFSLLLHRYSGRLSSLIEHVLTTTEPCHLEKRHGLRAEARAGQEGVSRKSITHSVLHCPIGAQHDPNSPNPLASRVRRRMEASSRSGLDSTGFGLDGRDEFGSFAIGSQRSTVLDNSRRDSATLNDAEVSQDGWLRATGKAVIDGSQTAISRPKPKDGFSESLDDILEVFTTGRAVASIDTTGRAAVACSDKPQRSHHALHHSAVAASVETTSISEKCNAPMNASMHVSVPPCIHTSIHPCMHPCMYPCMHPCMHPCIHVSMYPSMHAFMDPHMYHIR